MKQVSLYEAKTHLSKLVDEAAAGEEIVIAKNGKPKARLAPIVEVPSRKEPRKLGQWAEANKDVDWDKWWRDWKAADKEIEADFEASIAKPFPGFSEDPAPVRSLAPKKRGKRVKRPSRRKRDRRR